MVTWTAGDTITADKLNYFGFQSGDVKLTARITPPTGWLLCDGSAVSRTTYSDLFTAISTAYGVGDGSTTFNVPNFLGRMVIGSGSGSGLTARARGDTGGAESVTTGYPDATQTDNSYTGGGTHHPNHRHTAATMSPFGVATYIIKT